MEKFGANRSALGGEKGKAKKRGNGAKNLRSFSGGDNSARFGEGISLVISLKVRVPRDPLEVDGAGGGGEDGGPDK